MNSPRSVKDLSLFDYPPERIILVDNFISAFCRHSDNGIPILPYYHGTLDVELEKLADYIKKELVGRPDVRPVVRETFNTGLYHKYKDVREFVALLQNDLKLGGDGS